MVGRYLVALGGSPAKRNQHLAAIRGFFDRLVQRHVVVINPAASVSGVKEQVVKGKTPEITLEQTRKLVASIKVSREVTNKRGKWSGRRRWWWGCGTGQSCPRCGLLPAGPGWSPS